MPQNCTFVAYFVLFLCTPKPKAVTATTTINTDTLNASISCERVSWITMWLLQQISATAIEFETKFVYTHILFLFTGVVWTNRICVYVKNLTEIIVGEGSMK